MSLLLKNCSIVHADYTEFNDVLIENGVIKEIGKINSADDTLDLEGNFLCPGFIDIHTHLDDQIGTYQLADDWYKGSSIAIINGITSLYNFITQRPNESLKEAIDKGFIKAEHNSFTHFAWHLTPHDIPNTDINTLISFITSDYPTLKLYTTYKQAGIYSGYAEIEDLINKLKQYDPLFLIHCEDDEILQNALDQGLDLTNYANHSVIRSESAETIALTKIIAIAERTNARIHIVHNSTAAGAILISEAKKKGLRISNETCPQYLFMNTDKFLSENGYQYFCSPPLRSEENRLEMLKLLDNGSFDMITTDHCPFYKQDKSCNKDNILKIANGMPGLGALVPLCYDYLKNMHENYMNLLVKYLSLNPSHIMKLYPHKGIIKVGADADLTVINKNGKPRNIVSSLSDVYDPYSGLQTDLNIAYVFLKGIMTVKNNIIINEQPQGEFLWKK